MTNFPSNDALGIAKLLGNLEQPLERDTAPRAGQPGSSQSGHWIDLIGPLFWVCRQIPSVANHRRPALPAGNRLSGKQVP